MRLGRAGKREGVDHEVERLVLVTVPTEVTNAAEGPCCLMLARESSQAVALTPNLRTKRYAVSCS